MSITFNASRCRARLYDIARNWNDAVEDGLDRMAELQQTNAMSSTKYITRSQNGLRANIKISKPGPFERRVLADARHAWWIENGNGTPGEYIYPKKAKFLRFISPTTGEVVYAKRVRVSLARRPMETAQGLVLRLGPTLIVSRINRLLETGT